MERILDHKTNVYPPTSYLYTFFLRQITTYDLLCSWGEESENHLVVDLNLDTKNTVKSQLRKTTYANSDNFGSEQDYDVNDDLIDDLLDDEEISEDKSIEMMIQEMIKLKHQLQEEDEMIEQLAVVCLHFLHVIYCIFICLKEEQQVDLLISRLAAL